METYVECVDKDLFQVVARFNSQEAWQAKHAALMTVCWGPVRVGTRSGLGPIWALMFFVKNFTFRVQTAPFDKITIDFCRSRRRLHDSDLPGAKKHKIEPTIPKIPQKSRKILQNQWIPRVPRWRPMWRPMWSYKFF